LEKEKTMYRSIVRIAPKGIALATGIAVIVTATLKSLDVSAGVSLLGLGLAALSLSNLPDGDR
jgi:hypothetical protein